MCAAGGAEQQGVARRIVARAVSVRADFDETAVGVLAASGGDALGDDGRPRATAEVNHLGTGVGLLEVVGDGYAVELGL